MSFTTTRINLEGIIFSEIRQILYDLIYKWNLKKKTKTDQIQSADWCLGERQCQKVQTSNYKITPGDIIYSMVTVINNIVLHI